MERKVARAKGDRTVEEKKELEAEILIAEKEYQKINKDHQEISESLKKLDDDLRTVEKKVKKKKTKKITGPTPSGFSCAIPQGVGAIYLLAKTNFFFF